MHALRSSSSLDSTFIFRLGLVIYAMLLGLSVFFYKERIIFIDLAFHLFDILRTDALAIQNYRFGAAATQVVPLWAARAGLSLQHVAMLYSMSFIIYYSAVFIVLSRWLKNSVMALAMLLFSTLMVTHTFYWAQSELPQGMAFTFIYFALLINVLQQNKASLSFVALALPVLIVVCFFHPLLLFVLTFVLVFLGLSYPTQRKFLAYNFAAIVAIYAIRNIVFKTTYDSGAYGNLLKNLWELFPNYFTIQSVKNFVKYLLRDYNILLLVGAWCVYFYARQREKMAWLKAAWLVAVCAGYSFMINISYPQGATQFYLENQYLLLGVMVAIPFVLDVLPTISTQKQRGIIAFIALTGIIRIYWNHDIYTTRLDWYRQFLTQAEQREQPKIVVSANKLPLDTVLMAWGGTYEFWLLSTLERGKTASITVSSDLDGLNWTMGNRRALVTDWGVFEYKDLPARYFICNDTSLYVRYE